MTTGVTPRQRGGVGQGIGGGDARVGGSTHLASIQPDGEGLGGHHIIGVDHDDGGIRSLHRGTRHNLSVGEPSPSPANR
jgi:hypothetical protein